MKKAEFVAAVQAGQLLAVGEYRNSVSDNINWRDPESGRVIPIKTARHAVEFGDKSVAVQERFDESYDMTKWAPPFKKGQQVVLHIETFSRQKGNYVASGKLELLEA